MTVEELKSRADRVEGYYLSLKNRKADLEKEVTGLKTECDILVKTSVVLKYLLDSMVKDDITKMSSLITYGLKTIFDDQDLSFLPVITKKNEKIWVELKTLNGKIEGEFGSFGGSVAVIESFLLRILCILKMNLAKFMLLDESFSAISDEYIANTGKLIGELSQKIGLDVLLVTHQEKEKFKEYANTVYQVSEGTNGIKMEKIK
jgi:hypothetical protein